jgi:hypothetical protein
MVGIGITTQVKPSVESLVVHSRIEQTIMKDKTPSPPEPINSTSIPQRHSYWVPRSRKWPVVDGHGVFWPCCCRIGSWDQAMELIFTSVLRPYLKIHSEGAICPNPVRNISPPMSWCKASRKRGRSMKWWVLELLLRLNLRWKVSLCILVSNKP